MDHFLVIPAAKPIQFRWLFLCSHIVNIFNIMYYLSQIGALVIEIQEGQLKDKGVRVVHQAVREAGVLVSRQRVNDVMKVTDPTGKLLL